MRKVVGAAMRGSRHMVRELLRQRRRRTRCAERPNSPEPQVEGVIYLTPDGDGYVLYATRPAAMVAAVS